LVLLEHPTLPGQAGLRQCPLLAQRFDEAWQIGHGLGRSHFK